MVSYNYDRSYSLVVGKPPSYVTSFPTPFTDEIAGITKTPYDPPNFRTKVLNALEFTTKDNPNPLRISASITATTNTQGSDGVQAEIKIYNLSEDSLTIVADKNNFVILKAGYKAQEKEDTLPIIFSGQVESVYTERNGSDLVTTLYCKSGYTPSNAIRVAVSIPPVPSSIATNQINYKDVFDKLTSIWKQNGISYDTSTVELNAGIPLTPKFPNEITLDNGWSFEGYLRDAMDEVCESLGYVWYIQNDILYVHPKFYEKQKQALLLDNNLIKSLRPQKIGFRSTSTKSDKAGYLAKISLDGRVKLIDYVRIKDNKGLESTYKVSQVSHTLDLRTDVWDTDMYIEAL